MKPKSSWNLNDPLLCFHALKEEIPWTIGHACEGTLVFGATGSGKTSGTGTHLPAAMLKAGFGGLVLCAKPDEPERFLSLAKACNREADVVMFGPGYDHRFNFLDAELEAGTESLIQAFDQISQAISGEAEDKGDVWDKASKQLLRNVLDLFRLCRRPVQIPEIYKAVVDESYQDSLILSCTTESYHDEQDLQIIKSYLQKEFREMGDKTKASVLMNLTATLDPFLRGSMRELFCTETTVRPEDTRDGKIIIINLPLKTHKQLGRAAAVAWKFSFQRAIEGYFGKPGQHTADSSTRPVFLFADECQYFATSYDAVFQTTARSARACTVYLTQNIANLWLIGGRKAKEATSSLLGNLQTRVLHQNGCPETYKWFCDVLGRELVERAGRSADFHQEGGGGANVSIQRDVQLDARDFQVLAKGGHDFRKVVTAIFQQGGRTFKGNRLWTQIAFQQGIMPI